MSEIKKSNLCFVLLRDLYKKQTNEDNLFKLLERERDFYVFCVLKNRFQKEFGWNCLGFVEFVFFLFSENEQEKPSHKMTSLRNRRIIAVIVDDRCSFIFDFKVDLMCFFEELLKFPLAFAIKPKNVFVILEQRKSVGDCEQCNSQLFAVGI